MRKTLFSDFPATSYNQWQEQTTKDLKGKPFEDLFNHTSDGILVGPLYSAENQKHTLGQQPVSVTQGWVTVEEILVEDAAKANRVALDVLNRGANGLLFYVFDDVDIERLLDGILMQHITLHFVVEGDGHAVLKNWLSLAQRKGILAEALRGSINTDPIEAAARTGNWRDSAEGDLAMLQEVVDASPPGIKSLCVNNNLFANAGATPAQQLGLALAHGNEYITRMGTDDVHRIWVNMAIGGRYFKEIAKFRAMRRLWLFLLNSYGLKEIPLPLYAETGIRNKTMYDPWVNMLRSTSEGMSAILGGCDELLLRSYDATYRKPVPLGYRVARNQQLVLAYESYFGAVKDPSAGSYYIEELTEELAEKGWEFFKQIEAQGGMIAALENGYIQTEIEKSQEQEQALFNEGRLPLLGTSIYPNKNEKLKQEVESALYAMPPTGATAIRPVVQRRLSEAMEKSRLDAE
jgi:methylmalonyl-CoA mutase